MSFARPSVLAGVHPDTVRIVAMSAAIALNAAALIAVMRPMVANLASPPVAQEPIRLIEHLVEPKPLPAPPPVALKPLPVKPPRTVTPVTRPIASPPVQTAVPTDEGSAPAVPAVPTVAPASATDTPSAPVEATLAYVSAPAPAYPRMAIGGRMQGTVTLRVLVDEAGKPLDVVIESSSGHTVLDKAARDQVLARWRFQPAQRDGHAVQAWARIPITFDLKNL